MSRYIGNYLRVPSLEPQQASAPGIWSLSDQLAYQRANLWPPARDPYYNQTVLHLSGDVAGTRETNPVTQPRTFLSDASSNNFLLAPNGDVSARPFNPYLNNYSNFFDGTANGSLRADSTADTNLSGDFTIQAWVFPTANGQSNNSEIISRGAATTLNGWRLGLIASTTQPFFGINYASSGNTSTCTQSSTNIPLNQWTYVAVTRSGNTCRIYINGVLDTTNTGFTNTPTVSGTEYVYVGRGSYDTTNRQFTGYVTNASIIKGTALTTFNQTQPLVTGTSGQALLTCTANRFIDTNTATTAKLLTVGSGASVSQNSPFVSSDTTSGSGYFDGSGDYLTAPASNIVDFAAGQAFTFECWVYVSSIATSQAITASGANTLSLAISGGQILYGKSGVIDLLVGTMAPANQWVHVAVGRNSSNTSRLWVNGTSVATSSSDTYSYNVATMYIGSNASPASYLNGYISNLRVIKGTDVYGVNNTNITVPTAPLQAVSGTSLLTLQTRAPANNQGILDTSPNSFVVTRTGNVAQGSFSPFSAGGWSNFLDGSTAYFTAAANSAINDFGTGDFNIELWFYATSANFAIEPSLLSCAVAWATSVAYQFEIRTGGIVYFFAGDSVPIQINSGATTVAVNTWNHVAASRASGTTRLFVNGTQVSSTNTAATISKSSTAVTIGAFSNAAQKFTGYLSNVRIVKGQALYTGNFTPPTSTLTTISVGTAGTNVATSVTGTVGLLTCQSNRFLDQTGKTITVVGSPTVQPFSPFAPTQAYVASQLGGSAYFDGTTDYLSVPDNAAFTLGTNSFTAEAWVYPTTSSVARMIMGQYEDADNTGSFLLYLNSGNKLVCIIPALSITITGATNVPANAWSHVVITRSGSSFAIFLNGSRDASPATNSGALTDSTYAFTFGADRDGNNLLHTGYIASARLVNGTAIYDPTQTNFPIPITPPTAVPGTSLLLNFTGAGIVDSTGRNVVETVGNSAVQITQSRWPPGSMYFDGNGDYLVAPSSQFWTLGSTEDFTIEFWFYTSVTVPISGSTPSTLISNYPDWNTWTNRWAIATNDNKIKWYDHTGNPAIASNNFTYSVWNHVAVVRSSSSIKMYINGTQEGSTQTTNQTYTSTEKLYVGLVPSGVAFNGYIDDLRITKGYARYITGTGANANQMVFNGTNTLAFPTINTRPFSLA